MKSKSENCINAEEFWSACEYRDEINMMHTAEIKLYSGGKRIHVTEKEVEDFRFTGLNNWDFVCAFMPLPEAPEK